MSVMGVKWQQIVGLVSFRPVAAVIPCCNDLKRHGPFVAIFFLLQNHVIRYQLYLL